LVICLRIVVARNWDHATPNEARAIVNGGRRIVTRIGDVGATQARHTIASTNATLVQHIPVAITLSFRDARPTTHAAVVNDVAFAIACTCQNAFAATHATFVKVIASAVVHGGIGLVVACVLVRAADAETCSAAGIVVHACTWIKVASERVGAPLATAIVVCCLRVEIHGAGARASKDDATSVVFTGSRIVVLCFIVCASRNVAFAIARVRSKPIATAHTAFVQDIACTVAYTFRNASSTTHPALVHHQTTAVVHAGQIIVVASKLVGAAQLACSTANSTWVKNVARTITRPLWDAISSANPTFVRVDA